MSGSTPLRDHGSQDPSQFGKLMKSGPLSIWKNKSQGSCPSGRPRSEKVRSSGPFLSEELRGVGVPLHLRTNGLRLPLCRGLWDSGPPPRMTTGVRTPVQKGGQELQGPWAPGEPSSSAFLHRKGTRVATPYGHPKVGPAKSGDGRATREGPRERLRSLTSDSTAPARLWPRGLTGPRCVLTVVAMVLRRPSASPTAQ